MENKKTFKSVFGDMVFRRLEGISINIINDAECKKLSKRLSYLHKEIQEQLPEQYKKLINEYEETWSHIEGISDSIIYEHGLKDGAELRDIISN